MEKKAEAFKAEGLKAMNKKTMLGSIFGIGKEQQYSDAADYFTKAGNAYKLANNWQAAAEMFEKAADCWSLADAGSMTDNVNAIVEAGNCYKKIDPVKAISTFEKAISIFQDCGRFAQTARYYKEIAEIFEADNNPEQAVQNYEEAAKIFGQDKQKSKSSECLKKVALLATEAGNLTRAAEIFELLAREACESNLGKFSAKGFLLQMLLCHLAAGDVVASRIKLEEAKGIDFQFPSSRECDFIEKILQATETFDAEAFANACADFDRVTPLDPWKTNVLMKVKDVINAAAGESEADVC